MTVPLAFRAGRAKTSPWTVSHEQDGSRFPAPGACRSRILRRRVSGRQTGSFVLCAVTGVQIPLEALRYWSVDLQEAYATPEIATRRFQETGRTPEMIQRRLFLAGAAALATVSRAAWADSLADYRSRARWSRAVSSSARRTPAPGSPSTRTRCACRRRAFSHSASTTTSQGRQPSPRACRRHDRKPNGHANAAEITKSSASTGCPKIRDPPADVIARIKREGAMIAQARMRDTARPGSPTGSTGRRQASSAACSAASAF
jgi:hypothetical protein